MEFSMQMLAYCGLYCEQCSVRVAFKEQDRDHLPGIPARYQRDWSDLSAFDCEGCKGKNLCGPCKIKDCAKVRNIDSCAECADFPCEVLAAFGSDGAPHHHQAVENLRVIREHGIDEWFKDLQPPLFCHCGKRQTWYYTCSKHQQPAKKD